MSRVAEFTKDITQVGIRAQCIEENKFIKENNIRTFYAFEIRNGKYGRNWEDKIINSLKKKTDICLPIERSRVYFFRGPTLGPAGRLGSPEGCS